MPTSEINDSGEPRLSKWQNDIKPRHIVPKFNSIKCLIVPIDIYSETYDIDLWKGGVLEDLFFIDSFLNGIISSNQYNVYQVILKHYYTDRKSVV